MGVKYFNIEFDKKVYYPGQTVYGRVHLSLDKPKELRGIELSLSGKAKCHWTTSESYTDSSGNRQTRSKSHNGKETYFKNKQNLFGGKGQKEELPIGDYVYPFSIILPAPLPPSYSGTYGSIAYYAKVKLDIPWAPDKLERQHFLVESPLNLNTLPALNEPYQNEKSKTFCCWCCASGPLTLTVQIPRTAYVYNESIPVTLEVDNVSNVSVNSVTIELHQSIKWKATDDTKHEQSKLKMQNLGPVAENGSKMWNENFDLGPNRYPNSGNCGIIQINYELEIVLDANGPHTDLELKIPVTIGDIPYGAVATNEVPPTAAGFDGSPWPNLTTPTGFGYNPAPSSAVGFFPTNNYPVAGYPPADPQSNFGTSAVPGVGPPYSGNIPPPIAGVQYPGSTPQPNAGPSYPIATSTPNTQPSYSSMYGPPPALNPFSDAPLQPTFAPQPSAPSDAAWK